MRSPEVYTIPYSFGSVLEMRRIKTEWYDRYRLQEICFSTFCTPTQRSH